MKILVTGSKGFIASKVVTKLEGMGHEVTGYDIADGMDLLNFYDLEKCIEKVDVVYHIAAEADLTKMTDLEGGLKGVHTNVIGTNNVAYQCAKHNKWLIYASTVCVYGNQMIHPEKEDHTLPNPSELYACSKYAGEWLVRGYSLNFKNSYTILRFASYTILRFATIYGEGMRPALGMHIFFRQAMKGEPITVHGEGKQDRTLTYIHDLVDGIVAPLNSPEKDKGEIFNLSTDFPVTANQMAQDIKLLTESKSEIVHIPQRDNQTFHDIKLLVECLMSSRQRYFLVGKQRHHGVKVYGIHMRG
jgi:nucleoside-diphosphate-sugar epimerase